MPENLDDHAAIAQGGDRARLLIGIPTERMPVGHDEDVADLTPDALRAV